MLSNLGELLRAGWREMAPLPMIKAKGRVIVLSGAGLSADSGLGLYRGVSGAWTRYPQAREALDIMNWPESREEAFRYLREVESVARDAQPNEGHRELARWQRAWGERVVLITQNIDGLLQKAGAKDVLEIHGSVMRMSCPNCLAKWPSKRGLPMEPCAKCGEALTKPDVIFFNESAPEYDRMDELARASELTANDVFVAVGTSWTVLHPRRFAPTRGRSFALQLSVDREIKQDVADYFHEQSAEGASKGLRWARSRILDHWR